LVVRKRSTGARGFLDHKTVQSLTAPLLGFSLDEQFRHYALMEHLLNPQDVPERFQIYSMLKKSKRTARAAPPFYSRYEIYINDPELRAFWTRLWGEIRDLLSVEQGLDEGGDHRALAYPNPTRDCSWDCPFSVVCPMLDDDTSDAEYVLAERYETYDPLERYGQPADA
jgi:hypothetical protein